MEPKELIEPLSEVIRKYPRSGGPDPKGLQILRGGKIWGEGSADPKEVAKLLLGTQFDGKKATSSPIITLLKSARQSKLVFRVKK